MLAIEFPCRQRLGCDDSQALYSESSGLRYYKCGSCNLIWRDPSGVAESPAYDESYFGKYEQRLQSRIRKSDILLDMVEAHFRRGNLFELGPAMGYFLLAAQQRGWSVMGFDVSQYAVDHCTDQGLYVAKGTIEDVPEDSFDLGVMKHVLEHYPDPFKVLDHVRDSLRQDGGLLIAVPNADYWKSRILRGRYHEFQRGEQGSEHYVYFNKTNLRTVLDKTGFEVLCDDFQVFCGSDIASTVNRLVRRTQSSVGLGRELVFLARKVSKKKVEERDI